MEMFRSEGAFNPEFFGDRPDYYFKDNDGSKIRISDSLIEDRLIFGNVILNKDILITLLPILEKWVEIGDLPEIESTLIRGCHDCKLDLNGCGRCQPNIKRNGKFIYDDLKEDERVVNE